MDKKEIRFIDINHNELFRVPDGGQIIITYPNGAKQRATCKYISEQYMGIDGRCYHNLRWAELMKESGRTYAPAGAPEYSLENIVPEEVEFMYAKEDESIDRGFIGVLLADFDKGNDFYSTWWPDNEKLETQEFKEELDKVISYFRNEAETPILKNRLSMQNLCNSLKPTQSPMDKDVYGFKVITEKHTYFFRCNPRLGAYNLHAYCYNTELLNKFRNARLIENNIGEITKYAFFITDSCVKCIYYDPFPKGPNSDRSTKTKGQIVIQKITKEIIRESSKYNKDVDDFFAFIDGACEEHRIDASMSQFKDEFMKYIKKNPDFEGINDETVKKLKKYAKVAKNKSEPER